MSLEYPVISDGETTITFKPTTLVVVTPLSDKEVIIKLPFLKRNALLIGASSDKIYDILSGFKNVIDKQIEEHNSSEDL